MEEYEIKHIEEIRKMGPECMLMLKSSGTFPIAKPEKVALYGSGARKTLKGGTGSGDILVRHYVTIEEGLEKAGFEITTKKWLDSYDEVIKQANKEFCDRVKRRLPEDDFTVLNLGIGEKMNEPEYEIPIDGEGELAIYVIARVSGEGVDRLPVPGDFMLTKTEIRDILFLQRNYKKFLLVLNVVGPVDISPVADEVENILLASQTGIAVGDSFTDVLLGKSYPSGKLASTWAAWEDYCHVGDFATVDDTRYKEGIYVGYRYFDSVSKKPLFPFGYGKSFTEFTWETKNVSPDKTTVTLSVTVNNTGSFAGKEVIQVYVSVPEGKLDQPYQALAAFAKTKELKPGKSQELSISFDLRSLASFDENCACSILEKGCYVIRVGNSSDNTKPVAKVLLSEDAVVQKLSNSCAVETDEDWKPNTKRQIEILPDVPVFELSKEDVIEIANEEHKASSAAVKIAESLSDDELCRLCMGSFYDESVFSVIGNAGVKVVGSAGETTSLLTEKGVPAVVMADGPAGLRLAKYYYKDNDGEHIYDPDAYAGLEDVLPEKIFKAMGFDKKKEEKPVGELYMQCCSAVPIGTAVAQSWNTEIAEACGELVAREMEHFRVNLWLAPGLNIHRNPLCGRNFEYYSEDPLVSGKMAAAVTRGTQSIAGRGVTLKHFCCNSQETNRMRNNSIVSQRALRDIYLKGFEIAICESNPAAVMTSYNLLNGVHTSEREDLLETILRKEWGYKGTVMSDWVSAGVAEDATKKYRFANPDASINAGNDLMMPGGKLDYEIVKKALNDKTQGSLSRSNLEKSAARIIDLVWSLKK